MGHTSGLAKGFVIAALIVLGIIAIVSGIAYGLAGFFHSPYLFALFTAAAATGLSYLFYQPRSVCLKAGFSGLVGGAVGSLVTSALGGFLGVLAGMVVCVIVIFVMIIMILTFAPRKRKPGEPSQSWRPSKNR